MIVDFLKEVISGKANKFMLCALVYLVTDQAFLRSRITDLELQQKDCNEGYKDLLQMQISKSLTRTTTPKKLPHPTHTTYYLKPDEREYQINYYHIT